ncbi:hypothetical protein DSO57_1024416 [Entomophthora muscae]|uniref:Uncharacterized protein n=1 Tax=Entomophthora muscae TaxID=34485 RepID=A0ACC2SRY7_9FUNG|nr:hypothetical protein DSO57_1024416 [Entomophthora muscae]
MSSRYRNTMLSKVLCAGLKNQIKSVLRNGKEMSLPKKLMSTSVINAETKIGFVGLGQMGFHMANNLRSKMSNPMTVFDSNPEILAKFKEGKNGVKVAASPKEVAQHSSVIITMLPASEHVNAVYFGNNGLMEGASFGTLFIDSSTIDPHVSKEIAAKVEAAKCHAVDAPVSGGILGAEAGTLTFMVGGKSEQEFSQAKVYLQLMGKNIISCGGNGNGQVAKICNNLLLAIGMIGTSEAMNLGQKLGMDPKLLASILNTSTGRCWSSDTYNPCPGVLENVPSNRGYTGGFGVSLMAKDLGLAVNAANSVKANIILGTLAQQIYGLVSKTEGFKSSDFSSVFKWLQGKTPNSN